MWESEEGGQRSWHQQLWSDSSAEEVRHFSNRLSEDKRAATGQGGRKRHRGGGCVWSQIDSLEWICAYMAQAALHIHIIYLHLTLSPCRSPCPIYLSIYWVIAVTGYTRHDVSSRTYIPSPWGKSALIKAPVFTRGLWFIEDKGQAVTEEEAPWSISLMSYHLPMTHFDL